MLVLICYHLLVYRNLEQKEAQSGKNVLHIGSMLEWCLAQQNSFHWLLSLDVMVHK